LRAAVASPAPSVVPREIARVAAALAISLLLLPLWRGSGASEAYRRGVVFAAERVVLATQHFPLLASFPDLRPPESDFVVLLAAALTAVSIGIGRRRRTALLLVALVVTASLQVLAAVATIHLESAREMERSHGFLVLLPAEFLAVGQAKMMLYYAQLAVVFALVLATSAWRFALTARGAPSSRRVLTAAAALLLLSTASWIAWGRLREADARHVAAHAQVGHLFWVKRDDAVAEEQYRIAIAGRTTDPEAYFNLAGIEAKRGRFDDAGRLLRRCAELGADPVWAARVNRAFALLPRS